MLKASNLSFMWIKQGLWLKNRRGMVGGVEGKLCGQHSYGWGVEFLAAILHKRLHIDTSRGGFLILHCSSQLYERKCRQQLRRQRPASLR